MAEKEEEEEKEIPPSHNSGRWTPRRRRPRFLGWVRTRGLEMQPCVSMRAFGRDWQCIQGIIQYTEQSDPSVITDLRSCAGAWKKTHSFHVCGTYVNGHEMPKLPVDVQSLLLCSFYTRQQHIMVSLPSTITARIRFASMRTRELKPICLGHTCSLLTVRTSCGLPSPCRPTL
jgi:hypothetical protein